MIRPLILCSRSEIEDYCLENDLRFVTDKTNFSTDYTRNKIRIEILPKLLQINPALYEGVSRMTDSLSKDSALLENTAMEKLNEAKLGEYVYDSKKLALLPRPILTRTISLMLRERDIEPTAIKIRGYEKIIVLGEGKINVEKNKFATVKKGKAEIQIIIQKYRKKN